MKIEGQYRKGYFSLLGLLQVLFALLNIQNFSSCSLTSCFVILEETKLFLKVTIAQNSKMASSEISITPYQPENASELLRLLLELQSTYFQKIASEKLKKQNDAHDIKLSYSRYVDLINKNLGGDWTAFLAISENRIVGFIIGSIMRDEELVLNPVGQFEDWFLENEYRGKGIGMKLYEELEKWFRQKGCKQIMSETWPENELSIEAHKRLGFFISGISFGKILE
jgi:ribosomal protein S18 acetylase RimI-like enzyme